MWGSVSQSETWSGGTGWCLRASQLLTVHWFRSEAWKVISLASRFIYTHFARVLMSAVCHAQHPAPHTNPQTHSQPLMSAQGHWEPSCRGWNVRIEGQEPTESETSSCWPGDRWIYSLSCSDTFPSLTWARDMRHNHGTLWK